MPGGQSGEATGCTAASTNGVAMYVSIAGRDVRPAQSMDRGMMLDSFAYVVHSATRRVKTRERTDITSFITG